MTRITNAEQVLVLLRAQLERAARSGKKRARAKNVQPGPLRRIQQLAGAEGLSETEIARVLIGGLLREEFGAEFSVEPRFQTLVEDVRQMIDQDENGRALLKRAIAQLASR